MLIIRLSVWQNTYFLQNVQYFYANTQTYSLSTQYMYIPCNICYNFVLKNIQTLPRIDDSTMSW